MKGFVSLLTILLLSTSCTDHHDVESDNTEIIVEGWIENGGFPVVILTRSIPVTQAYQHVDSLGSYLIRWAKVTINDGTDSVTLTGRYDPGYYPPYVYTTSRMRGVPGKSYELTVDYKMFHATAVTSIPALPPATVFRVAPCSDSDTMYQITAHFKDNPQEKNYYQFFTRVGTSRKQFSASYLGSIDDAVLGENTTFQVYRGHEFASQHYSPYFHINDSVTVKFAQVDETSFQFWDSYIKVLSLSGNLFFSSYMNLCTNIHGGFGYWCGYGAVTQNIVIADSVQR